jgi:hypothetical protein
LRPQLQNLTLIPHSGLCNRLRAIASARRLCADVAAQCCVVWDWGEYASFFEPSPDISVVPSVCDTPDIVIRHQPTRINSNRTVDVTVQSARVFSNVIFWGSHELPITLEHVLPYFPALSARLQSKLDALTTADIRGAVGFHMRRTDNRSSRNRSPDVLFLRAGRRIVERGKKIFLATDNIETEKSIKKVFGDAVITYPKRQQLARRWPRSFDQTAIEDDLIELHLLARTQYVYGSFWSSYSRVAIAFNAAPQSRILDRRDWIYRCYRHTGMRKVVAGIRSAKRWAEVIHERRGI